MMHVIRSWKTREILHQVADGNLRNADLRGVNLSFADLKRRNLTGTDLRGAKLVRANLAAANLKDANLEGADIRGANLAGAKLINTNLRACNLSRSLLMWVTFKSVDFSSTNLYRATFGFTDVAFCETLHLAYRIGTVRHRGPSNVDRFTLRNCSQALPDIFLEGIGYTKREIKYIRKLYGENEMHYFSCFISHSGRDIDFATKLYKDLRSNNISCWHYVHDMRGGEDWRKQISEAIKANDKLILVCSRHSIYSPNVVMEILKAIDYERDSGRKKLFPIRLDDYILSTEMMDEAREKVRSGEWRENWVYYITRYHIPDFSDWKNSRAYKSEFQKLLEALLSMSGS